jgi:hypothetical protein
MNANEWLSAVETHLGRKARIYEQYYITRVFDPEETQETARIVAKLIKDTEGLK